MSLPIILVTTVAFATTVLSASIPPQNTERKPFDGSVETFDSYAVQNLPQQLPLTMQLPREERPVAFYQSQPATYLKAPQVNPNIQSDYYQVPIPVDVLTAPTEGAWNPNNDPSLYYELPALITKEETPTNGYPKKYNKDIHTKEKPYSSVPKHSIDLEPINGAQYMQKQKVLSKIVQNLAKKDNQKQIEVQKAQQAV